MNDDDVLLPGAVSAMSDAFSLAPDVIVAYGMEQVINIAGEVMQEFTELSTSNSGAPAVRPGCAATSWFVLSGNRFLMSVLV